jgi:hypothetical protein
MIRTRTPLAAPLKLIGLLSAAAVLRHKDLVESASDDLDNDDADVLGHAVLDFLYKIKDVGSALWFGSTYGWGYKRKVAADLVKLRPVAPALPRIVDQRRSELSRLAFRLLRSGATARALTAHMRSANAQYPNPLPETALAELTVWCAKRYLEDEAADANAAG